MQADATRVARTLGARLQHGRSGGVPGSRSPATTGFFDCTLSRSPWRAQNIPDGTIHTIGTGCTVNFRIKRCPTIRNDGHKRPTVSSTRFGGADSCHQCHPLHSSPGIRQWQPFALPLGGGQLPFWIDHPSWATTYISCMRPATIGGWRWDTGLHVLEGAGVRNREGAGTLGFTFSKALASMASHSRWQWDAGLRVLEGAGVRDREGADIPWLPLTRRVASRPLAEEHMTPPRRVLRAQLYSSKGWKALPTSSRWRTKEHRGTAVISIS